MLTKLLWRPEAATHTISATGEALAATRAGKGIAGPTVVVGRQGELSIAPKRT